MGNLFSKYPLRTWVVVVLGFFLVTLPVYLGAIWPILEWAHIVTPLPDNQTLPQWILERRWPGMTTTFFMWFIVAVSLLMLGLFIPLIRSVRQQKEETKQLEEIVLEKQTTQRTIEELQSRVKASEEKLATIERTRPHLTAEVVPLRQKIPSGHTALSNKVSFVFLHIRNEPPNHNVRAIAHSLHANISYCDEQWNPLCPSAQGVWRLTENVVRNYIQGLKPQDTAYLYLAMKTYREESCYTLDALNANSKEWRQSQHQLTNQTIYIKVVLRCHLYETAYYYVLTNEKGKENLECKEISSPEKTPIKNNQ